MLQRTSLFETHQKLGGRLIEFGGWEMPVQYTSIMDEHLAVRQAAGIFDISHMGELEVSGTASEAFLNQALTNDVRKLDIGEGQYTLMCNETGGVVDDLYLYRLEPEKYLLIVNASRTPADVEWLQGEWSRFPQKNQVVLRNVSDLFGAIAVQGPRVLDFIDHAIPGPAENGTPVRCVTELKKNQIAGFRCGDEIILVARTGYTGEQGFEIVATNKSIVTLWDRIFEVGKKHGLKPAGLGARDTLRTEMGYPLYGHELDEQTSPLEAGLGFFVALDKAAFNGKAALLEQKAQGLKKKLTAFRMTDKAAPPRPHYPIWSTGPGAARIGETVSGTQSPSLGVGIGLAYLDPAFSAADTTLEVEIRGRRSPGIVVARPLYNKKQN